MLHPDASNWFLPSLQKLGYFFAHELELQVSLVLQQLDPRDRQCQACLAFCAEDASVEQLVQKRHRGSERDRRRVPRGRWALFFDGEEDQRAENLGERVSCSLSGEIKNRTWMDFLPSDSRDRQ